MATLRADPALTALVDEHGPVAVEPAEDLFERTVVSILRQQLSMDAAAAIRERVFDAVEVTPQGVLAADPDVLRAAGCSAQKVEYLDAAATRFDERGYDRAYFAAMDDDAVIAELTEIPGFGPWTAKMVLIFGLGREDVFPVEDLGIRAAMGEVVDPTLTRAEMVDRATDWAPYRSYASLLLWAAID